MEISRYHHSMTLLDPTIMGHREAREDLHHALLQGKLPQAMLFAGPEGVGKRLVARALAKALVCPSAEGAGFACGQCRSCAQVERDAHPDVRLFRRDKTVFSVDLMRDEVLTWAALKPREGRRKVGIIDDVQHFSHGAANAFLKTLEEPPVGTYWILLTSDLTGTPPTIISRCQRLRFAGLREEELATLIGGALRADIDAVADERGAGISPEEMAFARSRASGSPGALLRLLSDATWTLLQWLSAREHSGPSAKDPLTTADLLLDKLKRKDDENQEPLRERLHVIVTELRARVYEALRQRGTPFDGAAERLLDALDALDQLHEAIDRNVSLKLVTANMMLRFEAIR